MMRTNILVFASLAICFNTNATTQEAIYASLKVIHTFSDVSAKDIIQAEDQGGLLIPPVCGKNGNWYYPLRQSRMKVYGTDFSLLREISIDTETFNNSEFFFSMDK